MKKFAFCLVAFACPVGAVGLAFASRLIEEEKLAMRVVGVGGMFFACVAVIALIGAFARKEKARWFTIPPLLVLLALFGGGVSA